MRRLKVFVETDKSLEIFGNDTVIVAEERLDKKSIGNKLLLGKIG